MSITAPRHDATRADPWRPRSLCFTLPVEPGQRVVVIGGDPSVASAARDLGADVVALPSADGVKLNVDDGCLDHVIVPAWDQPLESICEELARVLRPGGGLCVAMRPPRRLLHGPSAAARGQSILAAAGFERVRAFRLRRLERPRHLVPVDSGAAIRWYLRSAYPAVTLRQAIGVKLARALPPRHGLAALLPAVAFTARRSAP